MKIFYRVLNSTIAGGQRVVLDILAEAKQRGHQAIVSSSSPGRLTEVLRNSGTESHFLSLRKSYFFHQAAALAIYLKKANVDLVHSHDMATGNLLTRMAAGLARIPYISHIHIDNAYNANTWIKRLQIALDNFSSRFCQKLIAVSERTKQTLVNQGIPSNKIEVVRNGIEVPSPMPLKKKSQILSELNLPQNAKLIGCVARLCKVKGQKDLLTAAKSFANQKNIFFIFVGEDLETGGSYEKELKNHADSLGILSQVRFTGYQNDVNSFMHAFDCLVLPSWLEGLPLVALEAMACGKPVIATRVGGTPELVRDTETGFLVNPGDVPALVEALSPLLSNSSKAETMGQQGLEHVKQHFSKQQMLSRIMEIYQEVTESYHGPNRH